MGSDPLDILFVRRNEILGEQRELLAGLVAPFAAIDHESGEVYFKPAADKLSTKKRILVYLLACLAQSTRLDNARFAVSPKDVEQATGLRGGTVRPRLQELVDAHIVIKGKEGYFVDRNTLHRAADELKPRASE